MLWKIGGDYTWFSDRSEISIPITMKWKFNIKIIFKFLYKNFNIYSDLESSKFWEYAENFET